MADENHDAIDLDDIDKRLGTIIEGTEALIADVKAGRDVPVERYEKVKGDADALQELLPEDENGD